MKYFSIVAICICLATAMLSADQAHAVESHQGKPSKRSAALERYKSKFVLSGTVARLLKKEIAARSNA